MARRSIPLLVEEIDSDLVVRATAFAWVARGLVRVVVRDRGAK